MTTWIEFERESLEVNPMNKTYSAQVALTDWGKEIPIAGSKIQFNFCIQINWKRKSIITDKIVSLETLPVELVAYIYCLALKRKLPPL